MVTSGYAPNINHPLNTEGRDSAPVSAAQVGVASEAEGGRERQAGLGRLIEGAA
jgi:hypothetical protein